MYLRSIFSLLLVVGLVSCNEPGDIALVYKKKFIVQKNNDSVSAFMIAWGLDGEAWFLSGEQNPCIGFDSAKDVCFGRGAPAVYYRVMNDTINLFTNVAPLVPKSFPVNVRIKVLDILQANEIEKEFKLGKIEKLKFDTPVVHMPCKRVRYFTVYNMKFE